MSTEESTDVESKSVSNFFLPWSKSTDINIFSQIKIEPFEISNSNLKIKMDSLESNLNILMELVIIWTQYRRSRWDKFSSCRAKIKKICWNRPSQKFLDSVKSFWSFVKQKRLFRNLQWTTFKSTLGIWQHQPLFRSWKVTSRNLVPSSTLSSCANI